MMDKHENAFRGSTVEDVRTPVVDTVRERPKDRLTFSTVLKVSGTAAILSSFR